MCQLLKIYIVCLRFYSAFVFLHTIYFNAILDVLLNLFEENLLMYNYSSEAFLIPHSNSDKLTFLDSFRSLFYFLLPKETSFKDITYVPNYTASVSKRSINKLCNLF